MIPMVFMIIAAVLRYKFAVPSEVIHRGKVRLGHKLV